MTFWIIVGIIILIVILYQIEKKGDNNTQNSGVEFKVETTIDKSVDKDADKWEIVHRKTSRWAELGFENEEQEHDELFKREFEVWYCKTGSKEKIDIQKYQDESKYTNNLPQNYREITGLLRSTANQLSTVPKGYECIHSGLDNKNKKRWYFAIVKSERIKGTAKIDNFPGYGRLYERTFDLWYCEVGSKERKGIKQFTDKYPLHYSPRDYNQEVGENVFLEQLNNNKEYEILYSGLDSRERKRWYFGLVSKKPLWIQTERAIEKEEVVEKVVIEVPEGWKLVQNHSEKWKALGYDNGFPGYGKIHEVTFDMWYCNVGSKDKNNLIELKAELALYKGDNLYYFERVYKQVDELKDVHLNFEPLSRANEYLKLYNVSFRKKRWYLGIKEMTPRYIFTAGAN